MKKFQIRTALCAIALLFTFTIGAENISVANHSSSYIIGGKQEKNHKKNHKGNSAKGKKTKKGPHCDAY